MLFLRRDAAATFWFMEGVSGGEAFDLPGIVGLAGVEKSVVEPAFATLPELDACGDNAEAAPKGGERDFALTELPFHLFPFHFEDGAGGDDLALGGCPGGELGMEGTFHEVGDDLGGADFVGGAVDGDLALERQPGEKEGDVGIGGDMAGLAAIEIGEEDEALGIPVLEQDGAGRGASGVVDGGEDHGIGFEELSPFCLIEPGLELLEWVLGQVPFLDVTQVVIHPHGGETRLRGVGRCRHGVSVGAERPRGKGAVGWRGSEVETSKSSLFRPLMFQMAIVGIRVELCG